jgi:hypothetical protein
VVVGVKTELTISSLPARNRSEEQAASSLSILSIDGNISSVFVFVVSIGKPK